MQACSSVQPQLPTQPSRRPISKARSAAATEAHPGAPARGRPLGLRARSRRHHPGRIRPAAAFPRRAGGPRARSARSPSICARIQGAHGGWPLFHDGAFDISASVKAYFALKMIGDSVDAPHMVRAREAILAHGGAAQLQCLHPRPCSRCSAQVPWRGVPVMPVEIMLLPRWFPFHLDKISYWARTVMVPLLVLMALQPRRAQPARHRDRRAVRRRRPERVRDWPKRRRIRLRPGRPIFGAHRPAAAPGRAAVPGDAAPARDRRGRRLRHRAPQRRGRARRHLPGHGQHRDDVRRARLSAGPSASRASPRALDREAAGGRASDEAYCQPCLSPVWDTALACHALLEAGGERARRQRRARRSTGCSRCRCSTSSATGRCSARMCGRAAGRSNTPIRIIPISTTPPWWSWRWTARPRTAATGYAHARSSAAREWVERHAEPQRRLGRLRRRQHALLSEPHPVRRSRRAARSADRRRHARAASACWPSSAMTADEPGAGARPSTICCASRRRTAAGSAAGA